MRKRGGLAGAVEAEQADHLALGDGAGEGPDRAAVPVELGEPLDLDHGRSGWLGKRVKNHRPYNGQRRPRWRAGPPVARFPTAAPWLYSRADITMATRFVSDGPAWSDSLIDFEWLRQGPTKWSSAGLVGAGGGISRPARPRPHRCTGRFLHWPVGHAAGRT